MRSEWDLVIYRAKTNHSSDGHHAAVLGFGAGGDLEALLAQEARVISH